MSDKEKELQKNTFLEHLSEFRKRLTIVVIVNIIGMIICFQFVDILINYTLNVNPGMNLVYVSPSESLMVLIKTSVVVALALCSPVTIYQIWSFIAKGLYKREKIWVVISLIIGVIFFIGGVIFSYFIVLPITLHFFVRMELSSIESMISFSSYIAFINSFLFAFGIVFELPVLLVILAKFKLVSYKTLIKHQGLIIAGIFVVAAVITPPDVVSQILLGLPMTVLLQISIGACYLIEKRDMKKLKKKQERLKAS